MRNRRATNASAEADVRRTLAEYQAVRRQARELSRHEPQGDGPSDVHEAFERLAKATVRAEQMARDSLANAVSSLAGAGPCAVIVDFPGGPSVVALSGKPDGIIVAPAADHVPIREVVCRPEPPPEFAHQYRQTAPNQGGAYLVMQRGDVVAIYNGVYFRSTNEVVADLEDLIQSGLDGVWSDDYVIWSDGRIMAVIHQPMVGALQQLVLFNERGNDRIGGLAVDPMPFWPTYQEWVESGRVDLWKTDRYP
jgi:hypothetical protein